MIMKNKKVYNISEDWKEWMEWMEIKEKWLNEGFKEAMKSGKIKIL